MTNIPDPNDTSLPSPEVLRRALADPAISAGLAGVRHLLARSSTRSRAGDRITSPSRPARAPMGARSEMLNLSVKQALHIGSVQLPLKSVTKTFAILAKRGAGKSYTGAVMAEEFFKNGIPFVSWRRGSLPVPSKLYRWRRQYRREVKRNEASSWSIHD